MARENTKREMSDAAKEAKAKRQLASVGLGDAELNALKEKYGANAYDLIAAAMFPDNVRKALGGKTFKKSSTTIKDFINQPLTADQIQKVIGKKAEVVTSREETREELRQQAKKVETTQRKTPATQTKKPVAKPKEQPTTPTTPTTDYTHTPERTTPAYDWSRQNPPAGINKPITLTPDTVNTHIDKQGGGRAITFASSVKDDAGVTIPELAGATNDSIWGVTYKREVGTQANPVGARSGDGKYWGAMQYNQLGLENIVIYALTHPEYKNIADKFFKPGYEKALKEFEADVAKRGKSVAYATGQPKRIALAKYLKPDYKKLFQDEGKNNPEQFLQLQRDVSSDVTSSFHAKNYKNIVETLAKKGIKPEQVNPAIWGMVASVGIARGNIDGIANAFAGKDLQYINSGRMVDDLKAKYPTVFQKYASGRQAAQYAKDHVHEKHSATTSRELALMLDKPEIYTEYLQLMAENSVKGRDGKYVARAKTQQSPVQSAWNTQGNGVTL